MGKSKSIEEKMEDDRAFRDYMDELGAKDKLEEERILAEINKKVVAHYEGNGWDRSRLFGNKTSDYQNYDDWSLSRVNQIIDSIGTALSGGDFPSQKVPGSDDATGKAIEDAKDFLGAFQGDYSLVIKRVKAMVSGILSQFATASQTTRKTSMNDMPLSGGMHLFFGSTGKVFTQNAFFTNQFIGSFQIVFEVMMSVDEARAIGLQQMLLTTEEELSILKSMILDVRNEAASSLKEILKSKPKKYVSTKATYDVIIESLKEDRAELMLEYDKYNQVTSTVDSIMYKSNLKGTETDTGSELKSMFNEWEYNVAQRYIADKFPALAI